MSEKLGVFASSPNDEASPANGPAPSAIDADNVPDPMPFNVSKLGVPPFNADNVFVADVTIPAGSDATALTMPAIAPADSFPDIAPATVNADCAFFIPETTVEA